VELRHDIHQDIAWPVAFDDEQMIELLIDLAGQRPSRENEVAADFAGYSQAAGTRARCEQQQAQEQIQDGFVWKNVLHVQ